MQSERQTGPTLGATPGGVPAPAPVGPAAVEGSAAPPLGRRGRGARRVRLQLSYTDRAVAVGGDLVEDRQHVRRHFAAVEEAVAVAVELLDELAGVRLRGRRAPPLARGRRGRARGLAPDPR